MDGLLSKNVVTSERIRGSESRVFAAVENGYSSHPSIREGDGGRKVERRGRAMLTLFKRSNFLHFWRGANFAREINARFTRCYKDRIYVFVNPPPSLSLLRPFGAIFHSVAIGNIFAALPFRR